MAFWILPVPLKVNAEGFLVGPSARTSTVNSPSPDMPSTAETPYALAIFSTSPKCALAARNDAVRRLFGDV